MSGSMKIYVDLGGKDAIPHVFFGLTNTATSETRYFGYGPVKTGLFNQGKVFEGLVDSGKGTAGHMDHVAWESPAYSLNDSQLQAAQSVVDTWTSNPGNYVFLGHNCANFVQAVVNASGAPVPVTGVGFLTAHPVNFIPVAERTQFFHDFEGNPTTGGSLNDNALHPENYSTTPAYNYLRSGGPSSFISNPASSEQLLTGIDGITVESAYYSDGSHFNDFFASGSFLQTSYLTGGVTVSDRLNLNSDGALSSNTLKTVWSNGQDSIDSIGFDTLQKVWVEGRMSRNSGGGIMSQYLYNTSQLSNPDLICEQQVAQAFASMGVTFSQTGAIIYSPKYKWYSDPVEPALVEEISNVSPAANDVHEIDGLSRPLLPSARYIANEAHDATLERQVGGLVSAMASFSSGGSVQTSLSHRTQMFDQHPTLAVQP